jgi:hypothetical protein
MGERVECSPIAEEPPIDVGWASGLFGFVNMTPRQNGLNPTTAAGLMQRIMSHRTVVRLARVPEGVPDDPGTDAQDEAGDTGRGCSSADPLSGVRS